MGGGSEHVGKTCTSLHLSFQTHQMALMLTTSRAYRTKPAAAVDGALCLHPAGTQCVLVKGQFTTIFRCLK